MANERQEAQDQRVHEEEVAARLPSLVSLSDAPTLVSVRGKLPDPDLRCVAIVGTRRCSAGAAKYTAKLAYDLARAGAVVVSGGALGIDAAAHQGALDAGGETVAWLASGVEDPYPPQHAGLFDDIAESGALASEVMEPVTPRPGRFLARNRLVAAHARVVIVVQAPVRSGALSTARVALSLERPVFAVRSAPWDVLGRGCGAILKVGAMPLESLTEVWAALEATPKTVVASSKKRKKRSKGKRAQLSLDDLSGGDALELSSPTGKRSNPESLVAEALADGPRFPAEVARLVGCSDEDLRMTIIELELAGMIGRLADGRLARRDE